MTLVEILERNAKDIPGKVAIIYHDLRMTYGELNEAVNRLAYALLDLGLMKGDRVGLMLPRIPELITGFLGVAKAQGIVAPVNFELRDEDIRTVLNNLSPRFLIVHESFIDLAKRSIPQNLRISIVVVGNRCNEGDYLWDDIMRNRKISNPALEVREDGVVYFNYTSGSTGNPKGAITTHSNIFWNTLAAVDTLKLTPSDVHLCLFAPFAHPHEIFARSLYLGGTVVLLDKIRPRSIVQTISENKVTCFMGLAPMYETLLQVAGSERYDLSSLRIVESGGMHTKVELMKRFERSFGVPILPVWGSTEATGIAIANSPDGRLVYGSLGKACKFYEVEIVDVSGKELPPNKVGEMIFKGPAVVSGYYEVSEEDQRTFKNGWYYSGDLGRKDEDGYFYFVGRKSGMIKVAGLRVYPLEVELALMCHPHIEEAAVIGVKDRLRGEVPKAIVVLDDGLRMTEREIIKFCGEQIAHYKIPRLVEFRKYLPKIGSGKIDKKALRMEVA
ncbi:MAG: AMP-binding protein [Deltaproteobacteria bacterium]|nr:AMP-binding protein [Deltaproteobacteria bacterium]